MKEMEMLFINQKMANGSLICTNSVNLFEEIVGGYIMNIETRVVVKELTANEVIDLINQH